jgi:hypothetical protein
MFTADPSHHNPQSIWYVGDIFQDALRSLDFHHFRAEPVGLVLILKGKYRLHQQFCAVWHSTIVTVIHIIIYNVFEKWKVKLGDSAMSAITVPHSPKVWPNLYICPLHLNTMHLPGEEHQYKVHTHHRRLCSFSFTVSCLPSPWPSQETTGRSFLWDYTRDQQAHIEWCW